MKKSQEKHYGIKNRRFLWAEGLVICFFAIFAMSHNASAVTLSENVSLKASFSAPYWSYRSNDSWSSWSNTSVNRTYNDATITGLRLRSSNNTSIEVKQAQYVVAHGWFVFNEIAQSNVEFFNVVGYLGLSAASESRNCSIQKMEPFLQKYWAGTSAGAKERYTVDITCIVLEDSNFPILNFYTRSNVSGLSGTSTALSFNITGWDLYEVVPDATEKEENAANENIENGNTESDDSSSDATESTSSLISAIGSFVGAVTTAAPTNCRINGNMGNFDMGQIDLCANPVPTFVQIISSLILIAICIPFAIVMFNRFINLFRSFQE